MYIIIIFNSLSSQSFSLYLVIQSILSQPVYLVSRFCVSLAVCVGVELKRARKPSQELAFLPFFVFGFHFMLWSVWGGIKARSELWKRRNPPPPKLRDWGNCYILSLAIFLENYCSKKYHKITCILYFFGYI